MKHYLNRSLLVLTLAALPGLALAHLGGDAGSHHEIGFAAGFSHPFTGLDHVFAMIAVGIWSALASRRIWLAPSAFAGMLGIGALFGMAGVSLPLVEPMVAASLLVIGLLVAVRSSLPGTVSLMLIGGFALFHGLAHGSELMGAAALAGMLLGTLTLHLFGIGIGLMLKTRQAIWSQALGGLVGLVGAGLLAGIL